MTLPDPRFGLSFSQRRAVQLGLDPDEALLALLIHLKPPFLRLSLYWDEIAPQPGRYDFHVVRRQLDQAQQYGCRVLLTVGLKGQAEPGFFPPTWLRDTSPAGASGSEAPRGRLAANLLLMLERAVAYLSDYDVIDAWQVEAGPTAVPSVAAARWAISLPLLHREVEVVREVDARHRPVVISSVRGAAGQKHRQTARSLADVIGEDLMLQSRLGAGLMQPLLRRALASSSPLAHLVQKARDAQFRGKELWITALQAEPEAGASVPALHARRQRPGLLNLVEENVADARLLRPKRIYLRGAEWWLLRRHEGDSDWWEFARQLLRQEANPPP
ncbi:MAG: hypothetical protein ACR2PL_21785 [Dehalococcoidia bacterium]